MTRDIGAEFRALHQPGNPFILANAWDIGSAKMLAGLGAQAIGTSSAAHAFTLGRLDATITRDEALAHASDLVAATSLPVSGDFEDGFGAAPDYVAETVRLSAEAGLAGISIEDAFGGEAEAYDFDLAVERIRAAAAAARVLKGDFVLVARADGVMSGRYDIEEALRRIRAFDQAGADCLYVPIPNSIDDIKRVCQATAKPVNALAAGPYTKYARDDFAAIGVGRISLGSALVRATQRLIYTAASEMFGAGNFSPLGGGTVSNSEIDKLLG
ncbi:MAG: isocitrate lyase/PEP mutase family protein [Paracoccaceae bacterium]